MNWMIWSRNGIFTKIEEGEPTSLVNSLVYRRKQNGRLRLCLDPKDLNAAIQREHHVTPTLEEILPKLPGATVFSIVDAKCGYWNGVLDKASSYLTTFNSPFGRFRFNRMPFGLKMSQDLDIWRMRRSCRNCRWHRSVWQNHRRTRSQHACDVRTMPRDRAEAKSREMLCETRGDQILRCCLWQRRNPTRPK